MCAATFYRGAIGRCSLRAGRCNAYSNIHSAFTHLASDSQFCALGALLIGVLARISSLLGVAAILANKPCRELSVSRFNLLSEDLGEQVSRSSDNEATGRSSGNSTSWTRLSPPITEPHNQVFIGKRIQSSTKSMSLKRNSAGRQNAIDRLFEKLQ